MKKNFLIMMIMVLCAGFTFAQNTVRGFVPAAGTSDETYGVFGQLFGYNDGAVNEVAAGLGQAQILSDTVEVAVTCGESLQIGQFVLTADSIATLIPEDATKRDTFLTIQHPNAAQFNYDLLLVLHLFVCPCNVEDGEGHEYDVVAINNLCWTKSSLRTEALCVVDNVADGAGNVTTMSYSTDATPLIDTAVFGLLYTWENVLSGDECNEYGYVQGICPCGWHIPTATEVDTILKINTDALRASEGNYWVVAENITNATKFSAQPSGYYNALAERFEGYHSEADFWYVKNDCTANYFQILYYCDKPKQEPRNVNTDAMSVRCVRDMIFEYHQLGD